ncbi:MAG TPA: DsbA family protein, partial [Chthonomonadales bacterium]|nr:DsbA family protein [Chthonomonadales bacterium]
AGLQGKFWEMHDYLYTHQKEMELPGFDPRQFADYAEAIGLDPARFARDVQDPAVAARVRQDQAAGDQAGVKMTPTFYFISPTSIHSFAGAHQLLEQTSDTKGPIWK